MQIYTSFLFEDFLVAFGRFFDIDKHNGFQHAHYTFGDHDYAELMQRVL